MIEFIPEVSALSRFFDETIPLNYENLNLATRQMKKEYEFLQSFSVGKSVVGRGLVTMLLGSGSPAALYVGCHNAQHTHTSMLLLRFAEELCDYYQKGKELSGFDVRRILSSGSIYIIPMLNPDGVEISLQGASSAGSLKDNVRRMAKDDTSGWQANAHGVELNKNYPAGFELRRRADIAAGIFNPAPSGFGGTRAESEPESHALCNLCRHILFHRAFSFYEGDTPDQVEKIEWQYGQRTPKNSSDIAAVLASSSGYKMASPGETPQYATFKDWFINVFARPGFAVYSGGELSPFDTPSFPEQYEKIRDLLLLGLVL